MSLCLSSGRADLCHRVRRLCRQRAERRDAAVPRAQVETAESYGMSRAQVFRRVIVPQMWVYALPGLSNLWMILIKATPLLFLLGIQDIVYWARELGGTKTAVMPIRIPTGGCGISWPLVFYLA
jgi:polar amino acid transport system permease protein